MGTHAGCKSLLPCSDTCNGSQQRLCMQHALTRISHRHVPSAVRKLSSSRVRAAVLESAPAPTSAVEAVSTVEDLRALMFKQGWHRAWVDGISERAAKGELRTSTDKAAKVISFLEELGIPSQQVCNMASRVPRMLGLPEEQLQAIVAYLKEKGLNSGEMQAVLEKHPKLLLFSREGDVLALERARAQVSKDSAGRVGVQMYREGAFLKRGMGSSPA